MICTPTGRPEADGERQAAVAGDVDGDGEHVREVHLGGVADLADLERRGRRHRRQDDIHLLEGRRVVARDEGAHLLGRIVVLVVDAGRQKVAAEHDAAARLGAEALRAAGLVLAGQILVVRVAVAVAHRVEAGEVAEGLAGAEHVVGAHGGLGVWKLHFHQFRAHILKNSRGLFHLRPHLGRKTGRLHERGNDADLHAARALSEVGREVHVARLARAVQLVAAGKRVQRERRILHRTGEGAHLVERAAEGHHTVARHHAVGGLHGHQTAERARLADGAARIRPERHRHKARRHGRGASARAAAGHALDIPRVEGGAEGGGLGGAAEGELVPVQLADGKSAGAQRLFHAGRRVGGHVVAQHVRGARRVRAREVQVVLVAHGNARERAHLGEAPLGDGGVDASRRVEREFLGGFQEGMHRPVGLADALEGAAGHLGGRELLGGETGLNLANAHFSEGARH